MELLLVLEFSDLFFFHFKDFFKNAVFVEFTFNGVDSEPESFILFSEGLFLVFVIVEGLIDLKKVVFLVIELLTELDDFLFFFVDFILEFYD